MELPEELIERLPNIRKSQLEKYWRRYVKVMARHLAQQSFLKRDIMLLPLKAIQIEMRQCRVDGKRKWLFPLMHEAYPFFAVIEKLTISGADVGDAFHP